MKELSLVFLILINTLFVNISSAQDSEKIDSLKKVISTAKQDTSLVKAYIDLGYEFEHNMPDSALFYYILADSIATKSLRYFKENSNVKWGSIPYKLWSLKTKTLQNRGWVYTNQGYFEKALKYFQEALIINEKIVDTKGIARDLGNIGVNYSCQENHEKALEYFQKALKISLEIGDKYNIATNQGYIGHYYTTQKNIIKALECYQGAIKNFKDIGDKYGVATYIGNIGNIYYAQSKYNIALEYTREALKIYKEIGNKFGISSTLSQIGTIYIKLKQYDSSLTYNYEALKIAKEIEAIQLESIIYSDLSIIFQQLKQFESALYYKDSFILLNDSIFNTEKTKAITEMNIRYETEKKEKQIIQQQADIETSKLKAEKEKAEKENQRTQRNIFILAFSFMIVLLFFIIRSYNQKKRANHLLTEQKQLIAEANKELNLQNEEITTQRDEIENQRDIVILQKKKIEDIHKEISQSIDYATRLQSAILPETKILDSYLSDYFVMFKPKDKVSGDFYWWSHIEKHTIITAADCTGHGVPGAFMSMLGSSFLREIVQKEYITHTGVILRKLRKEIIKALNQNGGFGEQKDGMDMAIISINHESNLVQYSGANSPLYIFTNRKLEGRDPIIDIANFYEIKPDKMPIAIYEKMDNFTTHEIQLEKGDQLYLFSDGFSDQFGGHLGKKFNYKSFKKIIAENLNKSMKEQNDYLEKAFKEWKGNNEQVDDVLVLGIKI